MVGEVFVTAFDALSVCEVAFSAIFSRGAELG